jgi:hypothetical protein
MSLSSQVFALTCVLCACSSLASAQAPPKTVNSVNSSARQAVAGAPSLLIPPSSVGLDLCLGEDSGAYGNAMLAVTLSMARRDEVCSLIRQSKWAADLQHPDVSYQIMCRSGDWRAADAKTARLCR